MSFRSVQPYLVATDAEYTGGETAFGPQTQQCAACGGHAWKRAAGLGVSLVVALCAAAVVASSVSGASRPRASRGAEAGNAGVLRDLKAAPTRSPAGSAQLADPPTDSDSCRRLCLEEVKELPRRPNLTSLPSFEHLGSLDQDTKEAMSALHPDDMEEIINSQKYEMDTRYVNDTMVINERFAELTERYASYREMERKKQCDHSLWKSFTCASGRNIAGIRVNHLARDVWKLDRTRRSACMAGFQINWSNSVWPGVIVKDHPDIVQWAVENKYMLDPKGPNWGNVGAALAHIKLWDNLVNMRRPDDIFLAMEDNALFRPNSLQGMCEAIEAASDFDLLNLCVLRPQGELVNQTLGLYKVTKKPVAEVGHPDVWTPNVWMSSYLVTGRGAKKLLNCLQNKTHDFGKETSDEREIIDKVVSNQCMYGMNISAYVINHYDFFGHVETGGDSRMRFNDNESAPSPAATLSGSV